MSLMYAQMGMAAVGAYSGYQQQKHDAKMQQLQQAYQNKMSDISKAFSLNTQTENEINVRDAGVRASQAIQIQSMQNKSSAIVGAAAAGVHGSSVNSAMRGLTRSKLQASEALNFKMKAQARSDLTQRRNIHLSAAFNRDVSPIGKPSAASALLGLGMSMIDIYDSNQPEGQQSTDRLANWGRR